MKLNITQNKKSNAGMTLLELTVVILVLLSLISILFVGARAWKKGSDRSANILNIRNCQQAMRGHENMNQLLVGAGFTATDLGDYLTLPTGAGPITYTAGTVITAQSAEPAADYTHIWLQPSADGLPGADYGHTVVTDVTGW